MFSSPRLSYLQEAHRNGNLVPFVGAGFGAATASLPAWPGLLSRSIDYIRLVLPKSVAASRAKALEALAKTGDLPSAFGVLQQAVAEEGKEPFESIEYQGFLNEIFHLPNVQSSALADALRGLRPRTVITTNYDTLLEECNVARGNQSATWLNPPQIRSILRSGSGVIHLHGRYDLPSSVILSSADYQRVVDDRDLLSVAQAMFHSGVLLFVASSVGGLNDPHIGRILAEFARFSDQVQGEDSPHVALVPGKLTGTEIAKLRRLGVEAVSYGDSYEDLPAFLTTITEREKITVSCLEVRTLAESVAKAEDRAAAMRQIAEFITREVFGGRNVRITFCEKVVSGPDEAKLEAKYVMPFNATHNVFNYPLSVAAWSLVEGRIISWPEDRTAACNFDIIDRLGRLDQIADMVTSPKVESVPEISRFVDINFVRDAFFKRTLSLGDFFQDWSAGQPNPRYDRFLCVPVPVVESFGNREQVPEFGVFNIDTLGGAPLLDRRTSELLKLASSVAALVYRQQL
jgi:hypothetical protein